MNYTTEIKSDIQSEGLFKEVLRIVKIPILLGLLITPIRFGLEQLGIPEIYIFLVGLLWFSFGLSVYWGIKLFNKPKATLLLFYGLVIFSPITRIAVAVLWWLDRKFEMGSHYGLYFDNFPEALLNHVFYGALIQIIPGFLIDITTLALIRHFKTQGSKNG